MKKVIVKPIGFKDLQDRYMEILLDENSTISQLVNKFLQVMSVSEMNGDEIIVMCNNKQLYPDDKVPEDCQTIELFPFASGGKTLLY
ncbi:MAG: hypothetical protein QW348_01880 [Ignisphaera sp.]